MATTTTLVAQHPSDLIEAVKRQRAEALRAELADPRRRVCIIGISGCGKTYSACTTFPRVTVVDYDNQIDDKDCLAKLEGYFPMWNDTFVKTELKLEGTPIKRFVDLLTRLQPSMGPDQTLFIDSGTTFGDKIMSNLEARRATDGKTKDGDSNTYWLWAEWARGWLAVLTTIKEMKCNVVLALHESEMRDDTTGRLEKFGIALPGKQMTPRIPQFFTDVVRMTHEVEVDKGVLKGERWLWQIKPTVDFPQAKTKCRTKAVQIPARWEELIK